MMSTFNTYVQPEEKSTGFKFKRVYDENLKCAIPRTIQTKFQFVPMTKTLTALFDDPNFEGLYLDFNRNINHECGNGTFHNFCCGSVYKSSDFFKENPMAIQIRLFTDDFEPCDPLKSKVGVHGIKAFYFQVNNFPSNLLSKTDNIYLVALSDACDSKNELADDNNVLETIVADIKSLETKGILTKSGAILKGALICVSFDNLGGNVLFGFSAGFNANYFCRICTSQREKCQKMVKENPNNIRNITEYDDVMAQFESGNKLDLTATKGIKTMCALNSLNNFHILTNASVDLMHDIFEGSVGFLLYQVFNYCITHKIASIEQLQFLVQYYYYGEISKRNIPSKLMIDKKNVGQNASQAKCLILHLPFILFKFQDALKPIWLAVQSMLQIIHILLSDEMDEIDLERLSELITTHNECFQLYFQIPLKPKQHFLLHYVRVIKAMGPVVRFWAMRMEAKHQFFKQIVAKTKNFVNLKKTLSEKHQERFFVNKWSLNDDIELGKQTPFVECNDFQKYYEQLKALNFTDDVLESCFIVKKLKLNDRLYKPGFLVASETKFLEIEYILCTEQDFFFLCEKFYDILCYDPFFNSLKLHSNNDVGIVDLKKLQNNKPYEKNFVDDSVYVIVDCLTTFKMIK